MVLLKNKADGNRVSGVGGYDDKRVIITGGLGFIGSNLARSLVGLGARVTLVDSLIKQTGATYSEREQLLLGAYREATTKLPFVWTPAKN